MILALSGLLEDVLEGYWAVLEASCEPFGPS